MHLRHVFLLFALWTASALHAEIQVNTRFEPPRVAAGNTSRYIVEIVETDNSAMPQSERITSLPIPSNGGLTLRNGHTSTSQSTQFNNGRSEYSSTQQLIIDAVSKEPEATRFQHTSSNTKADAYKHRQPHSKSSSAMPMPHRPSTSSFPQSRRTGTALCRSDHPHHSQALYFQ